MLGSPAPATTSVFTETTPASPTRGSRLRGLSYLRTYTQNHLPSLAPRIDSHPLTRSVSSPGTPTNNSIPQTPDRESSAESQAPPSTIHSGENGWIPTIQGRSGLSRESAHPTTTLAAAASPEPGNSAAMTRNRAATALVPTATSSHASTPADRIPSSITPSTMPEVVATSRETPAILPTIRFIPHVEQRTTRPSLHFNAVSKTLKTPNGVVRVGRYSERDNVSGDPATVPVGFKSKVVSRRHCEFWCTDGQWYIKDVKSSSGTFLNHVRLSSPGVESRPYPVNDGDVVQLGIDFKGGEEVIFRCVKIRVECNRGWQKSLNSFNTTAHKQLFKSALKARKRDSDAASVSSSECSICLNPVAPCQALFVAPCSHVWHYKCIRNLIQGPNYPNFLCPNCRFVADLEADVEQPEPFEDSDEDDELHGSESQNGSHQTSNHLAGGGSEQDDAGESSDREGVATASRLNAVDGSLADQLGRTTLREISSSSSSGVMADAGLTAMSQDPEESSSRSPASLPIAISTLSRGSRQASSEHMGGRSSTPTSTSQFALAVGPAADGPMTPRNDIGPFVLDGSAGRANGNGASTYAHSPPGSES